MADAAYEVGFPSERAEQAFANVLAKIAPKDRQRVLEALHALGAHPRGFGKSFKFLRGALPVFGHVAQYRLRVGDWRIFYDVDDPRRKVVLLAIRRRNERTYD
ncbi:MAG: hypothetical protein A3C53_00820 [Omnitrophica WOR_2 bacterium RIFCSPHIGHO2_02_FULL_68_15]|nr:MAG: hypothetical protein A3C53_00820 [Omnitrophica WOR_2 bacterium RIFCSPHIGHO2_02_FULL_68_15]